MLSNIEPNFFSLSPCICGNAAQKLELLEIPGMIHRVLNLDFAEASLSSFIKFQYLQLPQVQYFDSSHYSAMYVSTQMLLYCVPHMLLYQWLTT